MQARPSPRPPLRMEKRLVACSHRASGLGVRAGARVPWQGHEDLRGEAGRSGSRVAARGSLASKSLPPPSFQLSDLVCGLTASGAHSGSLFSVTSQASPQTALLHDPLSCRPQTGTASQHPAATAVTAYRIRTAFYSRSIRLGPRMYEFKYE